MKDTNERYWLFVVFTARKTRRHLSATDFPPFSNIDFLSLLLSVCPCWYKPNKLEENNFCSLFLKRLPSVVSKCQTKFTQSKGWSICRLWALSTGHPAVSPRPASCLLFTALLDWDELGGAFTAANRDVCTSPGGLGFVGWTVLLLPPQADNTKKSTSARLISSPCPSAQRGLNHRVDFTCPSLYALFPVFFKSTAKLLGSMFVPFLSFKSCFNIFPFF